MHTPFPAYSAARILGFEKYRGILAEYLWWLILKSALMGSEVRFMLHFKASSIPCNGDKHYTLLFIKILLQTLLVP